MNRRKLIAAAATAALIMGMMGTAVALAVSTGPGQGFFELDAGLDKSDGTAPKAAVTDNASNTIPDDWDRVAADYGLATNGAVKSHANASTFDAETAADGTATNATIFTGGGSKDQGPISGWGWKDASGGLPDKDNLLHAMSARYGAGSTSHIYFAADRYDNSGDAQIGFWFFNSKVGPTAGGGFSGTHKAGEVPHNANNAGDILILSDFTNGGTQPTIRVYEYVGSGGSDGSLNLLGGTTTDIRDCSVVSTDDFCASVNNLDGAVAPWLFKNKSGATSFGHGEFYEGGLNLTSLGLQNECFSSFLAETRSAQSVTATLKDFVSGPFENCSTSVVTTPSVGAGGASIGTSGSIAVHDTAAVEVHGTATFSGTLAFHICGPIATGNCSTGGTAVAAAAGVNPVTANGSYASANYNITAAGRYCWRADFTIQSPAGIPGASDPADTTATSECFVINPVQPTISTNASPSVEIGNPIDDTATLGGTALDPDGTKADGTITFTLYGPNDATCSTVIETSVVTLTNGGDGNYKASDGVLSGTLGSLTPTAAGTYRWIASYSGDSPNTLGVSGACNDANEASILISIQPTLDTAQSFVPNDQAVVNVASGAGSLAGSVRFRLYDNATCTPAGTTLYDKAFTIGTDGTLSNGGLTWTVNTDNTTAYTADKSFSWLVQYVSTNGGHANVTSTCNTEHSSLTIVNGSQSNTP